VADPWYTGNFDATFDDVMAGCTAMLKKLLAKDKGEVR
jgi:protein-tyrosine phosphatase